MNGLAAFFASAGAWVLPLLLALTAGAGLVRRVDVYAALSDGAAEGLRTLLRILPALIALLPAVSMLRASGALDALAAFLAPLWAALGIPPETVPLLIVRPLSGSGAFAAAGDIIRSSGPDSFAGRVAAVMLGSTETTFYTITVYYGAAGITRTRHTVPAALAADAAGFLAAAWAVGMVFGA